MNFFSLIQFIRQTHVVLQQEAAKAINRNLTIRNWLIGFYIVEFEQNGEDRAKYGSRLIAELAKKVNEKSLSAGNLKVFRQFYVTYPQIGQIIIDQLRQIGSGTLSIRQSLIGQFENVDNQMNVIGQLPIGQFRAVQDAPLMVPPDKLITRLSYTHLVQLLPINDFLKRTFYEIECIKGNWSVAELKRQINSLYFERSGLSKDPEKLSSIVAEKAMAMQPTDIVKSIYTFEFLGLHAKDVIEENNLETALLDHLQQFMLELGHGFCFEARQKRILIGDEYFFIDLVFYHRILKCHILVDLKMGDFSHTDAGQLNTYLNYYKAEEALPGDNPPVGILLVTNQNHVLVEYATAGMDQHLFVSKYMVELPSKEQLENFIQKELKSL